MVISDGTGVLLIALAISLIGALLGTAGYAATVGRRQMRRIASLTELLVLTTDATEPLDTRKLEDPRLRAGFDRLASRMSQGWTLATVDLLTGVLNRQALLSRLEDELERAARYQRPCSVVLVDLDHFKRVNDTHGHAAGDLVLREVADVLHANVRTADIVGRYGGEEFMVVLPETDADAAAASAEKLRRLVGSREVRLDDGYVLSVTLSAGVAGGLGRHLQLDALVRDADAALYSAKALGRDQVYVFHELEEGSIVRRAAIGAEARDRAVEVGRVAMGAATASLTEALVARPSWAGKPSTMIAEMAVSLARALDLPAGEVERVRTASLLHDLGKLAIPDEILSNPGELTDPEWRVVSEHPKIGQIVLEQAGALRDAATIVLHHHEWYDGRGYPLGLTGQEIPVGARIVAIADAYEAMVAGRPYRTAIDHERALAELRRHAGVQFDPELVRLFAVLFEAGVPWEPGEPGLAADHPHPHELVADGRSHAQIHDDLHARRRRAVPTDRGVPAATTEGVVSVAVAAVAAETAKGPVRPIDLRNGTAG
jgi:diguanylate cyclase (GGDEF)-like protein